MTDPTPLSPTAQAVLDATGMQGTPQEIVARGIAAAALRAASSQLTSAKATDQLRAIAAELEGFNG